MKRKSFLLTLLAAVSALALMATPAEAGGKKKDRDRDWRDGDRRQGYSRRGWNRGHRQYRPAYRYRPVHYRPARYYRPAYYSPAPVFVFSFGFR